MMTDMNSSERANDLKKSEGYESSNETEHFTVKPLNLSLPKEWTSGCISELLDLLERSERRQVSINASI